MAKKLVLLIFILLVGKNLQSQIPEIRVTADTNNVLIGDQIKIILEARSKDKFSLNWTPLPDTLGTLEVIKRGKIDTISKQDFYSLRQNIFVTSFDGGTYPMPSLTFTVIHSDSSLDTLLTEPLYLKFNSVEVDTTKDIKDIKGPLGVPMDWKKYLLYLLILVIVIALSVFGYKYWKKRSQKKPDLGYDPSIPPHILALEALKQLESEKLWQSGYVKKYYIRLTDIIRIYIERQFKIMAMEMVTPEIISSLRENNFDQNLINDMSELFSIADFVKFAKHQPLPDENSKCMNYAVNFVNITSQIQSEDKLTELRNSAKEEAK
ncbi:hypothetical protein D9V86_01380 [Bacteroidetes/Chlorobi group bacterium ChocPot_Mid]|jgi:hypothetical protein|nr:MAG: hypothetical protein D9V86_01380 [Bacteroidetes/Chlorobi group bacterium ChocPot_Mid]